MKKTVILISSVFALCILSNIILMSFILSLLFQKNNNESNSIKEYYSYPNMVTNVDPEMAIPDKDTALQIGIIMLKQYLNVTDGDYKVSDMRFYWRVYVDNIIKDIDNGDTKNQWVLVGKNYVDFDKRDGRVLYAGYIETNDIKDSSQ